MLAFFGTEIYLIVTVTEMKKRQLYIAAYDIADAKRLRRALFAVRAYATGGQKSVFECFLTVAEKRSLLATVHAIINTQEDRFMLLKLDTRCRVRTLGIAVPPQDGVFYYVG
jgi:CRISPR-associated protein Cas2